MQIIGKITVNASVPQELSRLKDIAYNIWWTWNYKAKDVFMELDSALWEEKGHNPVAMLAELNYSSLASKLSNKSFMEKYSEVVTAFDDYMNKDCPTWFKENAKPEQKGLIAYFSAEYGLTEVLPIYSGGLGILSGDHCKTASDLGLDFVAVGFFYKQGYFTQQINTDGWQESIFKDNNPSLLPITMATDTNGVQLEIDITLDSRVVYAKIWKVNVGRISLFLLDCDIEKNSPSDRFITSRLYGGNQETRMQQEMLLGIGGLKVLDTLGLSPKVFHMNEGHSAFLGLELLRKLIQNNSLSFDEAKEVVARSLVFTTHTPVPAGTDVFSVEMMDRYFKDYHQSLGLSREEFLRLGNEGIDIYGFNMTVLAIKLSGRRNGVSKLHGEVSRKMFSGLFNKFSQKEVPIGHITNGIHSTSWVSKEFKILYDSYLPANWEERLYLPETFDKIDQIPDEKLWNAHLTLKKKTNEYIRQKLAIQGIYNGESGEILKEYEEVFKEDILTIGFARRFATYKRAGLIFRDIERIKKILNNPLMPVQIVFAGKAHPADRPAQELIKMIVELSKEEGFKGKLVLLENYNMEVASYLTSGVDIWLNNPRRPLEASGTSGQKVCVNGILNLSILDGWWAEGYDGSNGFAIGSDQEFDSEERQDDSDSLSLYSLLENKIVPLYYENRENGVPVNWVKVMKNSIKTNVPNFSTHRMLIDYSKQMYFPSCYETNKISDNNYASAKEYTSWLQYVKDSFDKIKLYSDYTVDFKIEAGGNITLYSYLDPGDISPSDLLVELCYGSPDNSGEITEPSFVKMEQVDKLQNGILKYGATIFADRTGELGYTFRVLPYSPHMIDKYAADTVKIAQKG